MPLYSYETIEHGEKQRGVLAADSYEEAKDTLLKEERFILTLQPLKKTARLTSFPTILLIDFTRSLSQLLKAGLPLFESLLTLEEKYCKTPQHALFLDLADKVKEGSSLSTALRNYPKYFDQIYISMVAAGEKTGDLAQAFADLTSLITRLHRVRSQLRSAMAYPLFLLAFAGGIIIALFYFLIPSLSELFEGRTLHPLTRAIIATSTWLTTHTVSLVATLAIAFVSIFFFFRYGPGKKLLYTLALKLPYLRPTLTAATLSRFCQTLGLLLGGGVPILLAMNFAKHAMKSPLFEAAVQKAEEGVAQGQKLSDELAKSPLFPSMVTRLLAIAEATGHQAEMLGKIAAIYEEDLDKRLKALTTMIQPVMLLLLALIVGLVVISVLLPLTDVSSFLN